MQFCGYGLARPEQSLEFARAVCDLLGHGASGLAITMLLETAAQETHLGQYRDPTPNGAGRGLFQCDKIAFIDVQRRARLNDINAVQQSFGFDIRAVQHAALDSSPLLAAVFARLFYKLIPDAFPADLPGRAAYWKRFYNTFDGRGTVDDYMLNAKRYL